jgi:hypothetical protein
MMISVDSDNEDSKDYKPLGFVGFGITSSNVYGGAFNSVPPPDRVGSAPPDYSLVSLFTSHFQKFGSFPP